MDRIGDSGPGLGSGLGWVGRKLRLIQQGDWHSFLKRVATRQSVGCKLEETLGLIMRGERPANESLSWPARGGIGFGLQTRGEMDLIKERNGFVYGYVLRGGAQGTTATLAPWLPGAVVAAAPSGIASRSPNPNEVVSSDTDSQPRALARERGGECIRLLTLIV